MKKKAITLLLSLVLASGSIGNVHALAADTTDQEADPVQEEETVEQEDDSVKEEEAVQENDASETEEAIDDEESYTSEEGEKDNASTLQDEAIENNDIEQDNTDYANQYNEENNDNAFFIGKEFRSLNSSEIITFEEKNGEIRATWKNEPYYFSFPLNITWNDSHTEFRQILSNKGVYGFGLIDGSVYGSTFKGQLRDDGIWSICLHNSQNNNLLQNAFILTDAEAEDSLTLEPSYRCEEGDTITVTGTYKSSKEQANASFKVSDGQSLSLSGTSVLAPSDTGEKDTWYISTMISAKKAGSYKIDLTVNGTTKSADLIVDPQKELSFYLSIGDATSNVIVIGENEALPVIAYYEYKDHDTAIEEAKKIKWSCSDTSVVQILNPQYTLEEGCIRISLNMCGVKPEKPGMYTITGNAPDGRTANADFYIEPKLITVSDGTEISKTADVVMLQATLETPNEEYLKAFIQSITGELKDDIGSIGGADSTRIEISDNGKTGKLIYTLTPKFGGSAEFSFKSPGGQKLVTTIYSDTNAYPWSEGKYTSRQMYGFSNPGEHISKKMYEKFFYSKSYARELYKYNEWGWDNFGGHGLCNGMVVTSMATLLKSSPAASSYGVNSLYDLTDYSKKSKATGISALDYIKYGQIAQFIPDVQIERTQHKGDLDGLYKAVSEFSGGAYDKPINIWIHEPGHGGHALWGLWAPPSYGSSEQEIHVYDCNYPGEDRILYLDYKSGHFCGWKYEFQDGEIWSGDQNGNIKGISFDNSSMECFMSRYADEVSPKTGDYNTIISLDMSATKYGSVMEWYSQQSSLQGQLLPILNNGTEAGQPSSTIQTFWYKGSNKSLDLDSIPAGTKITYALFSESLTVESEGDFDISFVGVDECSSLKINNSDKTRVSYYRPAEDNNHVDQIDMELSGEDIEVKTSDGTLYTSGASSISAILQSGEEDEEGNIINAVVSNNNTSVNPDNEYCVSKSKEGNISIDSISHEVFKTKETTISMARIASEANTSGIIIDLDQAKYNIQDGDVLEINATVKTDKKLTEGQKEYIGYFAYYANKRWNQLASWSIEGGTSKFKINQQINNWPKQGDVIFTVSVFPKDSFTVGSALVDKMFLVNISSKTASSDDQQGNNKEGKFGDSLFWSLGQDGTLLISGNGKMPDWTDGSQVPWHNYKAAIKSIVIKEGVTNIGPSAFLKCSNAVTVTIPKTVLRIEKHAFDGCASLATLVLPDGVLIIGEGAFSNCSGLTSITIPESVTSIEKLAFYGCTGFESISIPNSVTNIGSDAFYREASAEKVIIFTHNAYVKEYCKSQDYLFFDKTAPTINKIVSYNGSDIRVYIEKRDGASGYQIKYSDNSSMTSAKTVMIKDNNTLSKVISGLKNDKTYYVKLQTYQKIGDKTYWSKWSPAKSIKITQTPYPTNVSKLSTYIGSHIKVDWTKTAGASGYHIKYADNSSMTGAKEVMIKGNSTFTKTLTGLKNGKTYYVKIQTYRTVSGKTYWSSWSPAKSIKVDQKPYGSSISKLTNPSSKAMKITWDKASSATGYHIQYATNSGMTGAKDIMVNNKDTLSKTVTGLTKGKTYYVRIQTFRKVSGKTYWSSWSKAKQIKITK